MVGSRSLHLSSGQDSYNIWIYKKIVAMESIEFVQNFSDKDGDTIDPASIGMPPDFPRETRTIVTFKQLDSGQTEMTVTQYGMPSADSQMGKFAEIGLNQSIDKMLAIFKKNGHN